MGDYGGLCMNPINSTSLHPLRVDAEIHLMESKESGYYLVDK